MNRSGENAGLDNVGLDNESQNNERPESDPLDIDGRVLLAMS